MVDQRITVGFFVDFEISVGDPRRMRGRRVGNPALHPITDPFRDQRRIHQEDVNEHRNCHRLHKT